MRKICPGYVFLLTSSGAGITFHFPMANELRPAKMSLAKVRSRLLVAAPRFPSDGATIDGRSMLQAHHR